jgi:hypothetical protein
VKRLRRLGYVVFIVVVACVATYALWGALLFISAGLGR